MTQVGFYLMHRGWQDSPIFGRETYSRRDAWVLSLIHISEPTRH